MSGSHLPDELLVLAQVVAEDPGLGEWFRSLESLNPADRNRAIELLAVRMTDGGEDAGLIRALRLLSQPAVYDGVRATLSAPPA